MASNWVMTPERQQKKEYYNKVGWPKVLKKDDLELYMESGYPTIVNELGDRPDWPVKKLGGQIRVQLIDWEGFLSAFFMGAIYKGLKEAEYSHE